MEERKLTKADIDKVRHIEGFPIGKDEDIIALSRPPYYTACPNPFIEDFIRENGTPYDEATDDYHREPFAADVSEGKTILSTMRIATIPRCRIKPLCGIFCITPNRGILCLMAFAARE